MEKRKSSKTIMLICSIVALCLLAGGAIFMFMNNNSSDDNTKKALQVDGSVMTGNVKGDSIGERLKQAQEKVDAGMLAVDIAPNPTFDDGNSSGKIMVGNPSKNTNAFTVEFILQETNESIYLSGLIPPDNYIEEAKLSKSLSKGEYPATALFTAYDADGNEAGAVGIAITISVLN